MGNLDSEGAPPKHDERERSAFRVLQLQLQYLLHSHQALRQRVEDAEQVRSRKPPCTFVADPFKRLRVNLNKGQLVCSSV